jgi:repressor LexA
MSEPLTAKQSLVLRAVEDYWREHSVPPSITDLATVIKVSKATAYEHLQALKRKGHLDNIEGAARSWRPRHAKPANPNFIEIPLLGRVAAGVPILASENVDDWLSVENKNPHDVLFALRVQGQSMIGANILHNDIVITRKQDSANNGDIIVALIDGEVATVKQLQQKKNQVSLVAMNPDYEPINLAPDRVQILGKVIEVRRRIA